MDEVQRRYADQSPAWLIPRLAAIQNLRQLWAESAQKRAHDHRLQFRAMGAEDILEKEGEPEMPGDIYIQGDTYQVPTPAPTQAAPAVTTEKETSQTTTTTERGGVLPTLLVGAAMLVGGSGLGYIVNDLLKPQPAATSPAVPHSDTDTDQITEFDFPKE